MKNPYVVPLLAAITFGAAALVSEIEPSLIYAVVLVCIGIAGISTLILTFSLGESKNQGALRSAVFAAAAMATITIWLLLWLLPRVQIDPSVIPPATPTGFPNA